MASGIQIPDEPLPTPPWRKQRKAASRRQPLTQDAIVDAALGILDAEGLDAVNMRRIALELDTGPASLYAHVTNKDELLDLVLERVLAEIEIPAPDPARWQEQVKDGVREMRRVFLEHADIGRVTLANIPVGANALRIADAMMAIMLAGGVPRRVAAWSIDRVGLYVNADTYENALWTARQRASGKPVEEFEAEYFGQLGQYFQNLPADRFPTFVANLDVMMAGDGDERFEFGLDLLVRGLASYAADNTASS